MLLNIAFPSDQQCPVYKHSNRFFFKSQDYKIIKYLWYHAFIVDISVFVGGRSQIDENVWKSSDGSKIENKKYPPGDKSICQQMTWPLTYNDGVNLRSMKCNQEAYFICQTKCKFE